jgi:hypothetical protein
MRPISTLLISASSRFWISCSMASTVFLQHLHAHGSLTAGDHHALQDFVAVKRLASPVLFDDH